MKDFDVESIRNGMTPFALFHTSSKTYSYRDILFGNQRGSAKNQNHSCRNSSMNGKICTYSSF